MADADDTRPADDVRLAPAPILLLDAFSLLYRAFFALPPLTTKAGEPTSGLYGLSVLLLKLLREQKPKGGAFALDLPRPTFRHERWDGYKASRQAAPSALGRQVGRLGEVIAAFGFPALSSPGFEGDDVLATLATELSAGGEHPLVVSGDRDSLQLAHDGASVLYVGRGVKEKRYDAPEVQARFGVPPARLPDYVALVGDPSDDLPGVAGIGLKTAARLVTSLGGVDGILARLTEITPQRARDAIAAEGDRLRLWRDLARLHTDVPLPVGARWAVVTPEARERVRRLFEELEFVSLAARVDEAFAPALA
jgi:DNA polymerase-1